MTSRLQTGPPPGPKRTNLRDLTRLTERAPVEVEAKFLIEGAEQARALVDSLQPPETRSITSLNIVDSYWDTPDWSLYRAGWAYRWRDASGSKSLALKSIDGGSELLHRRRELEQPVSSFPGHNGHDHTGGWVTDQVDDLDLTGLRELFRVNNHRRQFDIRTPDESLVRAAIDQTTISTALPLEEPPPGCAAFIELELELVEGREESLLQLAKAVQKKYGLLRSRRGKFDRGLQAAGLSPPSAPASESLHENSSYLAEIHRLDFSPDDPAIHLAYRCFLDEFEGMLAQEPRAWEGLDPEGVHQMRVRTRRLRAAFRAFKDVMPAESVRAFNGEFKWVAAALGKVRDLDVYRASLDQYASGIPDVANEHDADYQRHLEDRWRKARKRLLACLESKRYARLKDRFTRFLERGPSQRAMKSSGNVTVAAASRQLIGKRFKSVLREGRAVTPTSTEESLHSLRINCKRLRYLFEFFDPVYDRTFKSEVKKLRNLQDVLGEFQDTCVGEQQLRHFVRNAPRKDRSLGHFIAFGYASSGQERQETIRWDDLPKAWMNFDRDGARDAVVTRLGEPAVPSRTDGRDREVALITPGRTPKSPRYRQACVIPFRRLGNDVSFCVITSFDNQRWIFPKGFVDGDESLQETGLKEAFEEAGLHGQVVGPSLGRYVYSKWGAVLDVEVMLMEVERADGAWLEGNRLRRWTSGKEALELIGKPELREMLRRGMRRLSG